MKALVKFGQQPGQLELREVPEPTAGPGTVLVEVKACGICGWDIEMWQHRMANAVTVPVTQGHEFCGLIVELGPDVQGWNIGDRVACETSAVICGRCLWCLGGDYQLCPDRKGFGYGVDGAFARHVTVRQDILHRIPEGLSFDEASLAEPFCVAHHALADQVTISRGDTVLVIGPGPIGLVCCQMASVLGASRVILVGVESDASRLKFAGDRGWADATLLANGDVPAAVMNATGGVGADVVTDCAGNTAALDTALKSVRRGGQIVKIGWGPKPFDRSLDDLLRKSIRLVGTFGHNARNWRAVLELLGTRRLDAQSLISGVMPLSRWLEAFEQVHRGHAIKIVLHPE